MKVQRAVFLDRDGVINKKRSDYVKSWNEFVFIEGVIDALKIFSKFGYKIIIVTNQSAVNRKIISEEELLKIHENMVSELSKFKIKIDAIFYCPHTPDENCNCRKPKMGLLERAIQEFNLSPENCILIGDSETDIQAGNTASIKTYLLNNEKTLFELVKSIFNQDNEA